MKGYYQVNYTWRGGAYAGLGADFEGKNNTYFQPPFLQFDLTTKMPVTKNLEVQVAVQNLFNTNDFFYLPQPNSGTTTTLGVSGSAYCGTSTYCQTTLPSTLVPAPPRTLRVQLRWHDGRP
jgi:outer membrane receptor protein involved in Fe transport